MIIEPPIKGEQKKSQRKKNKDPFWKPSNNNAVMACVNANLDSKARATMWLLVYSGPSYRLYIKEQLDPKGFRIQTKQMASANADPFFNAYVSFRH